MIRIVIILVTLASPALAYDPCMALRDQKGQSAAAMARYTACENAAHNPTAASKAVKKN